jgi:hypothetical protein
MILAVSCALVALSAALLAPSAFAEKDDTATYEYKPTDLYYNAIGLLDGGKLGSGACNPNVDAIWSGEVDTYSYITEKPTGEATFKIKDNGEAGKIFVQRTSFSNFSAMHSIVTACDNGMPPSPSSYSNSTCSPEPVDSDVLMVGKISGSVGKSVVVKWRVGQGVGSDDRLVPDSFSCVQPFTFPKATCRPLQTTIKKLTDKIVTLPFGCLGTTLTPPAGSGYSQYSSSAAAHGTVTLKRTKIH